MSPKTQRFARNIAGDDESVTVDVWALRVVDVEDRALVLGSGAEWACCMTTFICKTCGAESPTGIGYVSYSSELPQPAPDCPNPHKVEL